MTQAIDIVDGCGLSNEAHRKFLAKKTRLTLYFSPVKGIVQVLAT